MNTIISPHVLAVKIDGRERTKPVEVYPYREEFTIPEQFDDDIRELTGGLTAQGVRLGLTEGQVELRDPKGNVVDRCTVSVRATMDLY